MGTVQTIMQGLGKSVQVLPETCTAASLSNKETKPSVKPDIRSLQECLTKISPPQLVRR